LRLGHLELAGDGQDLGHSSIVLRQGAFRPALTLRVKSRGSCASKLTPVASSAERFALAWVREYATFAHFLQKANS